VCGHSFIRRYRDHLINQHRHFGFGALTNFTDCFELDGLQIYISGRGGLCADNAGIQFITQTIEETQPHLLVLELGTNDLTNRASADFVGSQIEELCRHLVRTTSVLFVVLCQVVRRYQTRDCPIDDFEDKRLSYNRIIQYAARRYPRLFVHRHHRAILVRLDSNITSDNIHITSPAGMRLYHFSLRKAIIYGLQELRRL